MPAPFPIPECLPPGPPSGLESAARASVNPAVGQRRSPCDPQFGPKTWFLPVNTKAALTELEPSAPTPPKRFQAITEPVVVATVTVPDGHFGTYLRVRCGLLDSQLAEAVSVALYFGKTPFPDAEITGVMFDAFWFPLKGRAPAKAELSIRAMLKQPYHSAGTPTPTRPIRSLITAFAELVLAVDPHQGPC